MAVSFGASGRYLRRTTNLPTSTSFTVAAWVYWTSIRNTYNYVFELGDSVTNAGTYCVLGHSNATSMEISTGGNFGTFGTNVSSATWTFAAITCAGTGATDFKGYWRAVTGATFNTTSTTGPSFTPAVLYVGNDSYDEYPDARIGPVYVFNRALGADELFRLSMQSLPLVRNGLQIYSPLWSPSHVLDLSGNGYDWTVGGTLSAADGPPIPWQRQLWVAPFVGAGASGIDGSASVTLAALTSTATGTVANNGSASATLAALTLTAAGSVGSTPITGAASSTLASLTSTAAGKVAASGAGSATLATLTSTAAGKVAISGSGAPTLAGITLVSKGFHLSGVCLAAAPLTIDSTNSRYVNDGTGPILLAGPHTWYDFIDGGVANPAPVFDWDAWDAKLIAIGANYERAWVGYESPMDWPDEDNTRFWPMPWERTGPGTATDGYAKFDLTKISHEFLERVEERVILAGNSGRYLSLMLFQGWQGDVKGLSPGNPVQHHAFASANNVNSMNGNPDGDQDILEIYDTSNTAALALQHAYIDALLVRLNRYPHISWEICNEMTATTTTTAWQHHIIDYIHTAEASLANQHLVVMSWQWPGGSNATDLYTSNADMVSTGGNDNTALSAPVVWPDTGASGKIGIMDTDHHGGLTPVDGWVQKAFCRGYGALLLMDSWNGEFADDWTSNATIDEMRYNLGYMVEYAARIDLANAAPNGALASTGYCLAVTSGRQQFIVYQPSSGSCTLNLTGYAGTFSVEYLRCNTGATSTGSTVAGNGTRTLNSPWSGEDYVAFVELSAISGAASSTLAAITVTATATTGATGTASVTLASITSTAAGTVKVAGSGAATLVGITATATATVAIVGSGAATLDAITLTATTSTSRTGSAAATLADLTVAAAGAVAVAGQLAATLASVTSTAEGAAAIAGSAAGTLAALTLTATGILGVTTTGQADVTLAGITGNAAGTVGISGAGAVALQDVTLTAAGAVPVTGQAAATLDGITVFATTSAVTFGTGTATLGDISATGAGIVGLILAVVTGTVRGAATSGTVRGAKATGTVKG